MHVNVKALHHDSFWQIWQKVLDLDLKQGKKRYNLIHQKTQHLTLWEARSPWLNVWVAKVLALDCKFDFYFKASSRYQCLAINWAYTISWCTWCIAKLMPSMIAPWPVWRHGFCARISWCIRSRSNAAQIYPNMRIYTIVHCNQRLWHMVTDTVRHHPHLQKSCHSDAQKTFRSIHRWRFMWCANTDGCIIPSWYAMMGEQVIVCEPKVIRFRVVQALQVSWSCSFFC